MKQPTSWSAPISFVPLTYDLQDGTVLRYVPMQPQADNVELAAKGRRIMLKHSRSGNPSVSVAEKDMVTAGWVIGVEA